MNKRYYKAFLLGIGVGLIITSSVNIIFMKNKDNILNEQLIRSEAKKLGMIDPSEYIDKSRVMNTPMNEAKPNPELSIEATEVPEVSNVVTVNIPQGSNSEDIADLLFTKQLITSKKSFLNNVYLKNYSGRLRWGIYKFNEGISEDVIIERLVDGDEE